jgi:hypothetical protein
MKTFLGRKVWGLRRSPGPAGTGPRRAVAAHAYVEVKKKNIKKKKYKKKYKKNKKKEKTKKIKQKIK